MMKIVNEEVVRISELGVITRQTWNNGSKSWGCASPKVARIFVNRTRCEAEKTLVVLWRNH